MAIVRPDRRDMRFVVACLLVILAGAVAFKLGFFRAFPEASIDFKVTREGARERASRALAERGFSVKGYKALVAFDADDEAKTFLERTLGLSKAGPLFGTKVPVWRWSVRFVRPLEKLEYLVWIAPSGDLLAFRRLLPEKEPAPDPGEDVARARAEETLRSMRGLDPAALRFVESSTDKRPARVDRTFVWESRTVVFGDAALRYLVQVQGDRVGRSTVFLEVPQSWRKEYGTLRSKNNASGAVATLGLLLTFAAVVVVAVERLRRRDVKVRLALSFGAAGIVLQLLSGLNELPGRLYDYPTSETWGGFVFHAGTNVVGGALLVGVILALLVAAGEPLYREAYPGLPSLGRTFGRRALGTRRFFRGLLLGYALTAAFLAYQVVFYIVAERFGAWAPADVPYSSLLGTAFPWLGVLIMGFLPATTEEFSSRMFSIPFLSRFIPQKAAVLIPAMIWGFAHSAYPNQPFFIRGVELTVVGVVIGAVMLREGLLPLLVWHFTVDAFYTALLLLRSSSTYFVVSGALSAFVLLLPLLAAVVLAWRRGGFLSEDELTNSAVGSAPPPERRTPEKTLSFAPPAPLARPLVVGLLGAGAVLLAAALALPHVSLDAGFTFGRGGALERADAALRSFGDEPRVYLRMPLAESVLPEYEEGDDIVPYSWSDDAALWLLQSGGLPELRRWAGGVLPGPVWQVRYLRPLDQHGAWIALDGRTGKVVGLRRSFPDAERGAQLGPDAARARSERLMRAASVEPSGLALVSQQATERKARRDHRIVLDVPGERPGGAPRRVVVALAGDAPALAATSLKLPEDWVRARDRTTPVTYAAVTAKVLGVAALIALAIVELVRAARRGVVPWRALLLPALLCTLPTLLLQLVSLPLVLRVLTPELSFGVFSVFAAIGELVGLALAFVLAYVALAFVRAARPDAFAAFRPETPGAGRALLAATGAAFVLVAASRFGGSLVAAFPAAAGIRGLSIPPGVETWLPLATLLQGALQNALLLGGAAALGTLLLRDFLKPWPMRIAGLLLFAGAFVPLAPRTLPELLVPWLKSLIVATALAAVLAVLLRDEPRAYVLAAALLAALRGGVALVSSDVPWWRVNGVLAMGGVALLFAIVGLRRRSASPVVPSEAPAG